MAANRDALLAAALYRTKPVSIDRLSESVSAPNALMNRAARSIGSASAARQARPVPFSGNRAVRYRITASGATFSGNTSFPTNSTSYTRAVNFSLPGTLVVEPRLPAQNRHGGNTREIGLFIGNDASLITAGTLRYGTNTLVHRFWGGSTNRPAIDTAFVQTNSRNRLTARVDPLSARNDATNLFSWNTSFLSAPKQILAGRVTLRFSNNGRRVSGEIVAYGNGFIEPGAYAYSATFRGNLWR